MIFPSTRQISAQTGQRIAPDYSSYISGEAQQLPTLMALRDQKNYQDQSQALEQQSLEQNQNQFDLNYALQQKALEQDKKSQKTANVLQMLGLAGAGASALNQYTDGGLAKWGSAALGSVIPSTDAVADAVPTTSILSQLGTGAQSLWEGAGNIAGNAGELVSDYVVQPFVDYVAEPVAEGASKLWDVAADSDVGSAIGSWVDTLWG
jgi:hypothetical protein